MPLKNEQAERKTFRLSHRIAVAITVGPTGMFVEWDPDIPNRLSREELRAYRKARNEMLLRLSAMVGGSVLLLEA